MDPRLTASLVTQNEPLTQLLALAERGALLTDDR